MIAYRYDKDGYWIPGEEIKINNSENLPENYTTKPIPQPCWKPVFNNGEWVETATEEEKNPILPPTPPTVEQQLKARLEALESATITLMDFM